MFREIRRKDRKISTEESMKILQNANYGILSVIGDNGYPYGVPVNYAYVDKKLYFHSTSQDSHKIAAIRENNKVCFSVVTKHDILLEKLSTNYESVVLFGTARVIDEPNEKVQAMRLMMSALGHGTKYATDHGCTTADYVMVEITPEHITGKGRR